MENTLQNFNHLAGFLQKRLIREINAEAEAECQLFADEEMKNRLPFSESPPIPKIPQIKKKLPLSAGVWNMVRQFLP